MVTKTRAAQPQSGGELIFGQQGSRTLQHRCQRGLIHVGDEFGAAGAPILIFNVVAQHYARHRGTVWKFDLERISLWPAWSRGKQSPSYALVVRGRR